MRMNGRAISADGGGPMNAGHDPKESPEDLSGGRRHEVRSGEEVHFEVFAILKSLAGQEDDPEGQR
jgi:hypothetical protein